MPTDMTKHGRRIARRLIGLYLILGAVAVVVVVVVVNAGANEKAQPVIAGGYTASAPNACLGPLPPRAGGAPLPVTAPAQPRVTGPSFNLLQSGQFVNITNNAGTLSGSCALRPGAFAAAGTA